MDRLLVVFLLTAFINLINSLTRSSRLSGVRTGSLATAISLFSVVYLAASFANTLQAPLLASTVEMIIKGAYDQALLLAPGADVTTVPVYQEALTDLNLKLRFVILGATAGSLLGMLAIPSFVTSFSNAINAFGRTGSVFKVIPLLLLTLLKPGGSILKIRMTSMANLKELFSRKMTIPGAFLFWNLFSYSLWTTNVLAGLYAGALFPEFRSTAIMMAAIVGNTSIVVNVMMVDPVLARVTDAVARGDEQEAGLKQIILYLAISNLLGTILAQAIFEPVARGLMILTRWVA